jgi:hypothetical protein
MGTHLGAASAIFTLFSTLIPHNSFNDAVLYTAKLSGIVKLAQLLVVQHAVVKSKAGRTQFLNDLVCEL